MKRVAGMLAASALFLAACDDFPRDPRGTLAAAQEESLRVGIIENPPWTRHDERPAGVEVLLVERFARQLGTETTWIRGGGSDLMPALERFQLHLVVGGLTDDTPWRNRVGLSRTYFTDRHGRRHVMAVPPGENAFVMRLDRFLVRQGEVVAEALQRQAPPP